ncbi:MAG: hypothetical protein ABR991_00645 [Terracidiphilus sp.]|jgi:hypothetical protein
MTHELEVELKDRVSLIESMIAEGRRTTQSWGWIFVLWGVAYYICIAGSVWFKTHDSPPAQRLTICMIQIVFFVILAVWIGGSYQKRGKGLMLPMSTLDRALYSIWLSAGISMAVLIVSLGYSGRSNSNLVVAVIATLLGMANAISSGILKWKLQFGCALIWWALAVISCIGTQRQSFIGLLVANFFCQIVFGVYGMICEARIHKQEAVHA